MSRPLALVVFVACLLLAAVASAKPKVALTPIEGDASGDIREAVAEALEGDELALISSKVVKRAVDKLGELAELTDKDLKKLANEIEADAVIVGKLDKVGKSKRVLKFRLLVDRKPAKGFTVTFKDARSEKFRTLLHDKMLDRLGVSGAGDAEPEEKPAKNAPPADDEEDPLVSQKDRSAKKKARAAVEEEARPTRDSAEDEPRASKKAKAAKLAEEEEPRKAPAEEEAEAKPAASAEEEGTQGGEEEAEAPRKSKKKVAMADVDEEGGEARVSAVAEVPHAANRVAVRVNLGVSMLRRSFKFNSRAFDNQPNDVALSPVPGARLEAELYPLAFGSSRGLAAGLGFAAEYDRTLKLNIRKTGVVAPAKQASYSIGLRYRLAFGTRETSPTLTLGAGYGKRMFSVDVGAVMEAAKSEIRRDTPESEYTVIDPGLEFRIPLTRMVAFSLGGRGLIIRAGGPILKGTSYGQAKVYGAEGLAALDVVLGRRFALRLSGELVQVGFQFRGVGELSNNLDGDPTTKDVGGLADRSLGGSATFSALY